ncbi:5-formyltetrahydrofolate cyclo-ligase [Sporosarcina saromensis]|uniref:5-formyltetrahydrofolate cyclo-ligase n=1 Tax=Sporosarcina saromensis TaxID=359365 RepID=A0ABU4G5S3_9BACL|nr:5-formyltetrahydrofolate cyclo-ligase [Sporosarcina saromensis]MDW0112256.1 5-formyltetrahydrofolate cyclo-ligase [Sporosarcina saromensis]
MGKQFTRTQILEVMNDIDRLAHADQSRKIFEQLCLTEVFKAASTVGITISRYPEIDTRTIIEHAWALGKRVAVPRCNPSTKEMDFRIINSYDDLEVVYMNLQEPIIDRSVSVRPDEIDLQVVPGVVFAKDGYRIGYGGGYYDRYLCAFQGNTLSLAFDLQVVEKIPIETYDQPVGKIITETAIIDCEAVREEND